MTHTSSKELRIVEGKSYLHGVSFEKRKFQIAVTLLRCIFNPMLVKPKCVWEVADFLKNCKQTAEKCKQIFENWKNLPPLKHILALPTLGQICTVTELQPFEISTFQMKHPVWPSLRVEIKEFFFKNRERNLP